MRFNSQRFLAVTTIALGVLAPVIQARSEVATLNVDDIDAIGQIGDDKLSLAEAIRLANGDLTPDALSDTERVHIQSVPGAASADKIVVVLPAGTILNATALLPPLTNNAGDEIDGGGAVLTDAASLDVGLMISSSKITVHNLGFTGFVTSLAVDPQGASLTDIAIIDNVLSNMKLVGLKVGTSVNGGSLNGLTVTGNTFNGKPFTGSVVSIAAANPATGGRVRKATLDNVSFAHNTVRGGIEGLYVFGAAALGGAADDATTRYVSITDNVFEDNTDASLNIAGSDGAAGFFRHTAVEHVVVERNTISVHNWGIGMWGGEPFGAGIANDSSVSDVLISDNQLTQAEGAPNALGLCIVLQAGRTDAPPGLARGDAIEHVQILNNSVRNCNQAITLDGGAVIVGGKASHNQVSDILIDGNQLENNQIGLIARGGEVELGAARVTNNIVNQMTVTENHFTGNQLAVHLIGGVAKNGVALDNQVGPDLSFSSNTYDGDAQQRCQIEDSTGNRARRNYARFSCDDVN